MAGAPAAKKMPRKDAMIRARTTPRLKREAEKVLDLLGLTPSEAINLFYRQVCLRRGLPFAVELPNEITIATFEKTDQGKELVHAEDAEALFKKLGI
jgi:DNA-damage-inducible protein J